TDADQADVDLELAHEVHRGLANDALVGRAHHPACHDHFAVRVGAQQSSNVQVVGDHAQTTVAPKFMGHRFNGGADVEDQRAAVRHALCNRACNAGLGIG